MSAAMTELAIQRLNARLRLEPDAAGEATRLRRLLAELIERSLEPALQRVGLDGRGELCIRRLDVPPLRLDLAATDGAIVERWAGAWADAIARRIARADAGVVRYESRIHALIDLVASATQGNLARTWAWRRLGMWDAGAAVTPADAAGLAMRALVADARLATAALAALAGAPQTLARWLHYCTDAGLARLALAVIEAAGGNPAALAGTASVPPDPSASWRPIVRQRLLGRSAIARALARLAPLAPRERRRSLALLVIAEAEPALLAANAGELRDLVDRLATTWAGAGSAADSGADVDHDEARSAVTAQPAQPTEAPPAAARHAGATERESRPRALEPPPWASATREAAPVDTPVASPRREAITAFGGLLFVLNLARDLGWPERWLHDPVLAPRGLRWTLHQLAQLLLPLAATDPAALAFAGLRPADDPPDLGEPPATDAERNALAQQRSEAIAALRRRLRETDADDAVLLSRTLRRRAEVVADPGWIEIRLSLDDVRSGIRIAGLDLDPGWLPWLGVVIRFVYE